MLDLFEAAAVGLGNLALDEDEAGEADGGVNPESADAPSARLSTIT